MSTSMSKKRVEGEIKQSNFIFAIASQFFLHVLSLHDYRQLELFLKFTKAHFINFAASNFLPQLERGFFQNSHSVANNNCNAKRIYCVCQIILFLKNDSQLNLGSFHRSTSAFTNYFSYIFISLFR